MSVGSITKNASTLFVGKIISSILGFLSSMLIARIMLPSEFGLINLALSIIFLTYPLVDLGMNHSLIYFIPRVIKKRGELKALLGIASKIKLSIGLIISIALFLSSGLIASVYSEPMLENIIKAFSIICLSYPLFLMFQSIFIGFQRMSYVTYSNVFFSIAKFAPIALFLLMGFWGAVYGYTILYVTSFIMAGLLFMKVYPRDSETGSFTCKRLLGLSGGMFLMTLFEQVFSNSIIVILGLFRSADEVAYISISMTIGILLSFGAVALGESLRPTVLEIESNDTKNTIKRITNYMILSTMPLATLAITLRSPIINFIYTSAYAAAAPTMAWVSIGFCIFGCSSSFYSVAQAMGRWGELTIAYIMAAVFGIIASLLLVPTEGSVGAAKAFVIGNIASTVYLAAKFRKTGYPTNILLKSVIASGVMLLPIVAVWNWTYGVYKLALCGTLGMATYLAAIWLTGCFDREDVMLLKKLFTKLRQKV